MTQTDSNPTTLDLYRKIHKALRLALYNLSETAGALDPSDMAERRAFAARFAEVDRMLTQHHGHEDGGAFGRLIKEVAPQFVEELEAGHEKSTEDLADLRSAVMAYSHGHDIADELYDRITSFVVDYLGHMAFEESQVMPELSARATPEELKNIEIGIRSSIDPSNMVVTLRWMLPAMNPQERLTMLGEMHAGAPPEIFTTYWTAAAHVLSDDELAYVSDRIGFSYSTVMA